MTTNRILATVCKSSMAAVFLLCAGPAAAEPQPVSSPNGTISGSIDGHALELPVLCRQSAGALDVSSHDQTISNSNSIDGVEPAVNIAAFEQGFQAVVFIGGTRYKFLQVNSALDTFPFTLERKVRAGKHGKIDVNITLSCPNP